MTQEPSNATVSFEMRIPRRDGLVKNRDRYLPTNNPRRGTTTATRQPKPPAPSSKRLPDIPPSAPPPFWKTQTAVALDNIAAAPGRPSRWDSEAKPSRPRGGRRASGGGEASSKRMTKPTRQRGSSPTPPNNNTKNGHSSKNQNSSKPRRKMPVNAPRRPAQFKAVRRKLSGDLRQPPQQKQPHRSSTEKKNERSRQQQKQTQIKKKSLTRVLAESDDEDDHLFIRRSASNKGLFGRDDSAADLNLSKYSSKPSPARVRRGKKRATVKQQQQQQQQPEQKTNVVQQCDSEDEEVEAEELMVDDSLAELVKAMDDDQGHIFLSRRHMFSCFESDDE